MIDGDQLHADLQALAAFGAGVGVTRPAFSPELLRAQAWLAERMGACAMRVRVDAAGNLIGRLGPDGPAVAIGSHIDTVPRGGRLDGTLGVLAGLACARALDPGALERAVEVVAFADEEGRFLSHLGSRAMTGALRAGELVDLTDADGIRFDDACAAAGLDHGRVGDAARPPHAFAAYIELHIEQGPVLEAAGVPLGIVTAIAGCDRTRYTFSGASGHSGSTPQAGRRDAFLAAAELAVTAERSVARFGSADTRLTFGDCRVAPGVDCVIPGSVELTSELRDPDAAVLHDARAWLDRLAGEIAQRRGLSVDARSYVRRAPAEMDRRIRSIIASACERAGSAAIDLVSGAGHDAQSFAPITPTGMIFVPSRGGHSHCPEEHTEPTDLEAGAEVLLGVVRELTAA